MSQNSRNQGFSYYFCLIIEGSGSVPLTNGSGSRRPKNTRILLVQIPNIAFHTFHILVTDLCIQWGTNKQTFLRRIQTPG